MQRAVYRKYLSSRDVTDILAGNRHALEGITILRKICNHPDILKRTIMDTDPDYGAVERSAKLQVTLKVCALRPLSWIEQLDRRNRWSTLSAPSMGIDLDYGAVKRSAKLQVTHQGLRRSSLFICYACGPLSLCTWVRRNVS